MNYRLRSRREFLETLGAAGAASLFAGVFGSPAAFAGEGAEKLAVKGGTPVRKTALGTGPYGPQFYDDVEKQQLIEVLESRMPFRWGTANSKVLQFEIAYADHLGVKYALGVTSGTTALHTALAALRIGPGDEVILPAWTWFADYDTIVLCGGLPVFAEIDESFNIDPNDIEARITPRTRAIIACHLQGTPADMDPIMEIARRHKLRVLEDCAQCAGGRYKGRYVGTIGDIGINSFQVSKTITAGEGGAVITNDAELFERACRFHDVATIRSPYQEMLKGGALAGFVSCNFRMNEFTGAVLYGQLQKLEIICKALRGNAAKVRQAVADIPGIKFRKSPDPEGDLGVSVFVDLGNGRRRAHYLHAMAAEGVPASPPGGSVILSTSDWIRAKSTIHPAWPSFQSAEGKAMRYGPESCPRTLDIIGRFAGVMMGPKFSDDDLRDAAQAIRKVYTALGPS
jgi:8-amino-3,8-dideoxy-alpha-D-manno-octulosonate transaminase